MSNLQQEIEEVSMHALDALGVGASRTRIVACFSLGQRVPFSPGDISGEPRRLMLQEKSRERLQQLEAAGKSDLKLVALEWERVSSCGISGTEERHDIARYDIVSRQVKHETFYV